jgi:hypothetical protein
VTVPSSIAPVSARPPLIAVDPFRASR